MRDQSVSGLSGLQLAGLALLTSTVVAVAIYFGLRRKPVLISPSLDQSTQHTEESALPERPSRATGTPNHFSEDLIVPGLTQTGDEIAEQDAKQGRSTEGV